MNERFFNTCTHDYIRHNLPGNGKVGPDRIRSAISKHAHLKSLTWHVLIIKKVNGLNLIKPPLFLKRNRMLFIPVIQINLFLTSISSDVSSSEVVAELCWSTSLISRRSKVMDMTVLFLHLSFHICKKKTCWGMNESFVLGGTGAVLLMAAFRDGRLCLD